MKRVVIVGTSGSGKSTLGGQLATVMDVPFIDLDALHWKPGWQEAPRDVFREQVYRALTPDDWVVGGNYGKARDVIWTRADTLVWLDYPLPLCLWRLLKRTIRRIISQEDLWGTGNRETWRAQFFSRHSLFLWAITSSQRHKRDYPVLLAQPEYTHLNVIRLHTPNATQSWIGSIAYELEKMIDSA